MGENRGKKFEDAIKKAFSICPGMSVDRIIDPQAGYAGVRNICDFIMYKHPHEIYMECKSHYGNTLNFKGDITQNQWDGLKEKSEIDGVIAGIMVWFIDHNRTVFVPIQELVKLQDQGKKSLNISQLVQNQNFYYLEMPGKLKRVYFEYDAKQFMDNLFKFWKLYKLT